MRHVVLNRHHRNAQLLTQVLSPAGGMVPGVSIHNDDLGGKFVQLQKSFDDLLVVGQGIGRFQIPDMLGKNHPVGLPQGNGVFLMCPHGQHGPPQGLLQRNGQGSVPPGAPNGYRRVANNPHHAVIRTIHNGTVMHQQVVHKMGQLFKGFRFIFYNGLIGQICRRHDQRHLQIVQQQMMQR